MTIQGKFLELLGNGDPYLRGVVDIKLLLDEAKKDFPNRDDRKFFRTEMLYSKGTETFVPWPMFQHVEYSIAVDEWFDRWFGNG